MNNLRVIAIFFLALSTSSAFAQQKMRLGDNAALRYWAAFSEMQDAGISDQQAKELNAILDGSAPYDDSKYKDLVEKNRPALELMTLGTRVPHCDWGLDYQLAEDVPMEYARKALPLGRLNVLYAFHLLIAGNKDGAIRTLASGLRFSQDVAEGGSLFAALAAKSLLTAHFRAIEFVSHVAGLSAAQRSVLQNAMTRLGPLGLDWQSAARLDLEGLRKHFSQDARSSAALTQISSLYVSTIGDPSGLPRLQQTIAAAPSQLSELIPNPMRVLEEKQDLQNKIAQLSSRLP